MPGEHTLVLAATTANRLTTFTVGADGALSAEEPFAAVDAPDGLAVDAGGNVYVAATVSGKGAIVVIDSKGKTLGAVPLDAQPTNCAFGGQGKKTLFVTARTSLYTLAVPIPGR